MIDEVGNFIGTVGLPAALCCFFVWHSSKRQQKTDDRIDELEQWVRGELVDIINNSNDTIKSNTAVMRDNMEVMKDIDQILKRSGEHQSAEELT